jgi:hypothetical protein
MRSLLLDYGPTVLTWAAVVYKVPALRRRPDDWSLRTLWLTLLALAVTLTLLLPPVYLGIDRLFGVPNLTRLLAHTLTLLASWSVQAYLAYLNYPEIEARPSVRRSGWLLLGTLVLMTIFFVLAPVDDEAPLDFMTRYGDAPFILEYRLVFLLYLGFALVNVVGLCWRYAGLADRPALSLGLRIDALGAVVGLGYVGHETARVAVMRFGVGYPIRDADALTQLLVAISITLIVVGSTIPSWGAHVGIPTLYRWMDHYRALRQLFGLWRVLCDAAPEIALVPPRSALTDALDLRDVRFRLYRRVVEIRDGELALRSYLDSRVPERARDFCWKAGVSSEQIDEHVEAACVAAALRAKARGRRTEHTAPVGQTGGEPYVAGEAAFLSRVARHYAHSPVVAGIMTQIEDEGFLGTGEVRRKAG